MKLRSLFTFAISAFALSLSWAQTIHQGFAMDDHTKVRRLVGQPPDPAGILPLNCPAGSVLSGGVCVPLPTNSPQGNFGYIGTAAGGCPPGSVPTNPTNVDTSDSTYIVVYQCFGFR